MCYYGLIPVYTVIGTGIVFIVGTGNYITYEFNPKLTDLFKLYRNRLLFG